MWIVLKNWRNKQAKGTIFSYCCWRGKEIVINGERIRNECMAVTSR
jgi:hypothetical protein